MTVFYCGAVLHHDYKINKEEKNVGVIFVFIKPNKSDRARKSTNQCLWNRLVSKFSYMQMTTFFGVDITLQRPEKHSKRKKKEKKKKKKKHKKESHKHRSDEKYIDQNRYSCIFIFIGYRKNQYN